MLLPRLLTAVVGIPLLLFLIHLGSWPFVVMTVALAVLALYEYGLILWLGGRPVQRIILVAGGGLVAAAVAVSPACEGFARGEFPAMALAAVLIVSLLREMMRPDHSLDRTALTVFGVLFVGWTLAHLALLRDLSPHGEAVTLFLFVSVWVTDTAAYAIGKPFGTRRMAPVLSPKKTWEGAAAGFLGALLTAAIAQRFFLRDAFSIGEALAAGVIVGTVGQASDIAESMIKRAVGVKDSSALLPGHGGVLDRCDSYLLTAPLLYYALMLK